MKLSRGVSFFSFLLVFGIWIYSFFFVPTFDLDESLYRRVAEEMKWSGNYWNPTWDGRPLFHKPPIFYWILVFFSRLFDGLDAGVSVLASRFPSFISTLGILFSLGVSQIKVERGSFSESTMEAYYASIFKTILLWSCAFFPLLTSTSVLFDPLQTLVLIPSLLIPHRAFSDGRELKKKELLLVSLSMTAATLIKGLNGIILPTLAFAVHALISNRKKWIRAGIRFFLFAILPAVLISSMYYWLLDIKIGRGFTEEFFLVHHFGRGIQAMEAHHGPFYYYFLVVLLGGGTLIPLLAHEIVRTHFDYRKLGFPLSYAISSVFFYSLSATKLPHYTWPIWPALILQILILKNEKDSMSPGIHRRKWMFSSLGIFALGAGLFGLVFNPDWLPQTELQTDEIFLITFAATLCFTFCIWMNKIIRQLEWLALFSCMISIAIAIPANQILSRVMVEPFFKIAQILKVQNPDLKDCIRYSGPHSATLSLALGKELGKSFVHNRCEPTEMNYLIVPSKKREECLAEKMEILAETGNLLLCQKRP